VKSKCQRPLDPVLRTGAKAGQESGYRIDINRSKQWFMPITIGYRSERVKVGVGITSAAFYQPLCMQNSIANRCS
jgi:hypothetical protein